LVLLQFDFGSVNHADDAGDEFIKKILMIVIQIHNNIFEFARTPVQQLFDFAVFKVVNL
jgi:hypothetical protein